MCCSLSSPFAHVTQDLWARDLSPPLLGHKHHGSVMEGWTSERWSPGSLTSSENSAGRAHSAREGEDREAGDCELLSLGLHFGGSRNSPAQGHRHEPTSLCGWLLPHPWALLPGRRRRFCRHLSCQDPAPFSACLVQKE